MENIKILIVEDDYEAALYLRSLLNEMGYVISGIFAKGEDAVEFIKKNIVDIVLIDIELEGKLDGVETIKKIKEITDIFTIYITALKDKNTFTRAKATFPEFFLSKPYNKFQLLNVIDEIINSDDNYLKSFEKDYFFIKENGANVYKKFPVNLIKYIKAHGSYIDIFLIGRPNHITISKNLKKTLENLNAKNIFRIHRSYAININEIDTIEEGKQIKLTDCNEIFTLQGAYKGDFNRIIRKI